MHATGDNLYLSPVAAFPRRGVGGLATRSKTHGINRKDFASVKQGRRAGIHCRRAGCRRLDAGRLGRDMARGFGGLVERFPMSADRGAKAAAGRLRTIADGFFDGPVCISTLRLRFDPKRKRHALWDRAHRSNNFKPHAEFPARRHKRSNMVPAYTRGQTAKSILRAWAGGHQLTYEDACIAAVAGGRWRESARVWTENNSFFKRAYATESIYREWECFSESWRFRLRKGDSDSPVEDKFEREPTPV